ncbi:hypothetical protein EJ02DRAFT_206990 [Clathrospora elynae]|uniref:BZIP domain-containing protein n=1 Tax=Clathrospora elynae TaxID=706981 RepID=A0A6A5SKN5_9PLEO|nr:hypothetical protein EJ02DRAFT_206990 [Clathrospora elynae]
MQYTTAIMQCGASQLFVIFRQPQQLRAVGNPSWYSLLDTTSLLPSTTTTSSSAAFTGDLFALDSSLNGGSDWNAFSLSDSQFLGDGTHLASGRPTLFTMEDNMDILAMSSGMQIIHDTNKSAPMMQGYSHSGSSSTSPKDQDSSSPEHSTPNSKFPTTKNSPLAPEPSRVEKRKANTLAARRYRQKRVDQMSTLEAELNEVKNERDGLKVRNARLEGEVETLRALLRTQK